MVETGPFHIFVQFLWDYPPLCRSCSQRRDAFWQLCRAKQTNISVWKMRVRGLGESEDEGVRVRVRG